MLLVYFKTNFFYKMHHFFLTKRKLYYIISSSIFFILQFIYFNNIFEFNNFYFYAYLLSHMSSGFKNIKNYLFVYLFKTFLFNIYYLNFYIKLLSHKNHFKIFMDVAYQFTHMFWSIFNNSINLFFFEFSIFTYKSLFTFYLLHMPFIILKFKLFFKKLLFICDLCNNNLFYPNYYYLYFSNKYFYINLYIFYSIYFKFLL